MPEQGSWWIHFPTAWTKADQEPLTSHHRTARHVVSSGEGQKRIAATALQHVARREHYVARCLGRDASFVRGDLR